MDQKQDNSPMISSKPFVYCVALGVAVFVIAFSMGVFSGPKIFTAKDPSNMAVENTYDAGWNAAKKRLAESDFAVISNSQDTRSVRGLIEAVNGERISLRIRPLEPLADPALDNRVILTNNATKVIRFDAKDVQKFGKEMDLFWENIKKNKAANNSATPEPFIKTIIAVGDLKVGDSIVVLAAEDIKIAKEFAATDIHIEGARAVSVATTSR